MGGSTTDSFFKGSLSKLHKRALALVGRVDPSVEGVAAATRFARKCVENGILVVSGLAKGIDAASHRGALLEPPGDTFAVVGHGLDYSYPRENVDLYEAIQSHGAVISQFRTGVGPQRWTFPARNEVMCTLALGTVIIEGKPGCGSLIQADFSFKHGRPVFVLGRNLKGSDSEWAAQLVKRGAHVIEHFDQVTAVVDGLLAKHLTANQRSIITPVPLFDNRIENPTDDAIAALFDLDGVILDTRGATAAALAAIATRHAGRSISADQVLLTGKPHDALARLGIKNAYQVYRAEYDTEFGRARGRISLFSAAVEGLRALRDKGVNLAAVTAQPRRRADIMLPEDVRTLFDVFLCYNDTLGKKDVGIGLALKALGVPPDRALFVGDQATDLEAARRTGVRGVGVLWGFSTEEELRRWPHDLLLAEPDEIGLGLLDILF